MIVRPPYVVNIHVARTPGARNELPFKYGGSLSFYGHFANQRLTN